MKERRNEWTKKMREKIDKEILFVQAHLYGAHYEFKEDLYIKIDSKETTPTTTKYKVNERTHGRTGGYTNKWINERMTDEKSDEQEPHLLDLLTVI